VPPSTTDLAPDPTSGATTDDEVASEDVDTDCRRLADFDSDEADRWLVVNDGVMGGRSNGAIDVTDSVMRFTGSVVTAGGGFTSVRLRLDGTELAGTTRVELRVRADQRTYGLTLQDDAQAGQRTVSHRADLAIDEAGDTDGWTTAKLSFADLRPSVFGQPVDAPPFNPDEASEFGIIIADGRDGDFALEVDWIDACR
jgi:NADH dehydrogenase [ubiquinone] 1 alpha subcomplex assembly factor 1